MRKYRMTQPDIKFLIDIIGTGRLWDLNRAERKQMKRINQTYSKNCITDTVNAIKIELGM